MTSVIETPHLNPLPKNGERRMRHGIATGTRAATATARVALIRLSLSQRQRMEVRDCFP